MTSRPWVKALGVVLVVAVIVISALALSVYDWGDDDSTMTETVSIRSDAELAESEYVARGNGTQGNPYVIEGLVISVYEYPDSTISHYGMKISGTHAHLLIFNLTFNVDRSGASLDYDHEMYYGLGLWGVCNLTVMSCSFESLSVGIAVAYSSVNISTNVFIRCIAGVHMGREGISPTDSAVCWRNEFRMCDYGILMEEWRNIGIRHNEFYRCEIDVRGYDNVAVDICSNVFWWSKVASISLSDISLASIMHNKASDGYGDSIKLTSASHMTIDDNSINTAGCGILILNSYNVTASNNSIGTMSYVDAVPAVSIGVYIESSRMVNLKDNSVTGTAVGIEIIPISDYVTTLSNITVYRNRIHSNAVNAIDMGGSENLWDDGIATGNYWDDYDGVDENADGIGDTPYVIDEDSVDHYPLMN